MRASCTLTALAVAACAAPPPEPYDPSAPGTLVEPPGLCGPVDLSDPGTTAGLVRALLGAAWQVDPARGRFGLPEGDAACPGAVPAAPGARWEGGCATDAGVRFTGALSQWPGSNGAGPSWEAERWRLDDGVAPRSIDGMVVPGRLDTTLDEHLVFDGWIIDAAHTAAAPEGLDGRLDLRQQPSPDAHTTDLAFDGRVVCRSGLLAQLALTGPGAIDTPGDTLGGAGVLRAEGREATLDATPDDAGCWRWTLDGVDQGPLCLEPPTRSGA